jgi:hypothetical protein
MPATAVNRASPSDVEILARLLGNGNGRMPRPIARYVLHLEFTSEEKARMHDLAVRNQADALSPQEKEEMFAYARAGTILSILCSRARQALKAQSKKSKMA